MNNQVPATDYLVNATDPEALDDLLQQFSSNACVLGRGMTDGIVYREGYPVVRVFGNPSRFQSVVAQQGYTIVKEIELDTRGQPTSPVGPLQRGAPEEDDVMKHLLYWQKREEQEAEDRRREDQRRQEKIEAERAKFRSNVIQRIRNQMVEEHFEPTVADFFTWVQTDFLFRKDQKAWLLEQQQQSYTLNELLGLLSEEETFDWFTAIEELLIARRGELL